MPDAQRSIELIFARTLMSHLSTPTFLVDEDAALVYFNPAAGDLLGLTWEEAGRMGAEEWGTRFGPFDPAGRQIPVEELPLTRAVRGGRPSHASCRIRSMTGDEHDIEVSAFPIVGSAQTRGAMAIFWRSEPAQG